MYLLTRQNLDKPTRDKIMNTLTNTINEMASVLGFNAIDLANEINVHNMLNEHEAIETEEELRTHLVSIAFNSRMSKKGKNVYSEVCKINDSYFKNKMAA